ncbi:hypothetical protein [Mesorhizobium sp. M4B.F.Ca.ET.013.02.1.1]|uniref:hypothetical protein n=1 Tax=Mesorhizobium sp. M4B.F.Ca.ET.013.02.1.1 TaxID=2496755 RepID=UPI000FD3CA2E|nr:hypothetical protein [Mesorhizobium sp. M4B.F.Ca.ET.013.02.1.1]RUW19195.1 hypothetical protein EOA34_30265 [Mesorhizobium sp. M4B.F.Ca.ET.013.02.1.1]
MITLETVKDFDEGLHSPFEKHPDLLVEIGRVVSLWGAISNMLRHFAAQILDCDPVKADTILTAFPGEERRLEFIVNLLSAKPLDQKSMALLAVLKSLKKLGTDRNLIVHGGPIWGGKKDLRPMDSYFVNFKVEDGAKRYVNARELLARHLAKLRFHGGELADLLHPDTST